MSLRAHLLQGLPAPMRRALARTRDGLTGALGLRPNARVQLQRSTVTLGNAGAAWTFCPDLLPPGGVVYTVGCGEDISFDLALLARYPVQVVAFDPTPKAIAFMRRQALPPAMRFVDAGLAHYDGTMTFHPPADPAHVSYSVAPAGSTSRGDVVARVQRLATFMRELGHQELALLKMDVEGTEYAIIDELTRAPLPVAQLLVEFHHGIGPYTWRQTRQAIQRLRRHGFQLAAISASQQDYCFVRTGP